METGMSITTDVVIVGAGPVGIFQVFELGLLDIKAHVVDSLPQVGGQCAELYPEKPIYDIPALPVVGAQELIDRLMAQIEPFGASFHLQQTVTEISRNEEGRFELTTNTGQRFDTAAIVIAAGLGAFQPRRLRAPGAEAFEDQSIHYKVTDKEAFRDKNLVILGGGDSALDWTVELADIAASIKLIHRRSEYRAQAATVKKMQALAQVKNIQPMHANIRSVVAESDTLKAVEVQTPDGERKIIAADQVLVFWGLSPNLGPIADWGLDLDKRQIPVDTEKYQTSEPGIYAIGDINTYAGKKKLILSGFHEAALAAFAIQKQLHPEKKVLLQYTTTSPIMHQRLGLKK